MKHKLKMLATNTPSIIIGLLIYIQLSLANELIISSINESEDILTNCVAKIIKTNFVSMPTVFISENERGVNATNSFSHKILTTPLINGFFSRILTEDIIFTRGMQDGLILFIKYLDDCEMILDLQSKPMDEKIKYLIIIFDFSKENCFIVFEDVGKNMSEYEITYIIKKPVEDDYDIITFIPHMNATTCTIQHNVPATLLSTCKSASNYDAFPLKKPQDLMLCPFKVGMASFFPFTKIANKTALQTNDPLYEHQGSDFELLKIMAHHFNFSLKFYYALRSEGNPFENTSFIEFLLNGSFDACAGGLYNIFGDAVDYSGVYGKQVVMWMYPVNRNKRSWQNLVPKLNGLYIFMIFYACYSIIWYLFCKYDKRAISVNDLLLYSWGTLIGNSSLREAVTLKQKILNIAYLVLCMHLSAYTSIKLYSFLTIVGPPRTYKTNTDLIESGLKPYLIPRMKNLVNDDAYETFANTSEECESFDACGEMSIKQNGVTVLVDSAFTLLQAETAVNDEARALSVTENVITVYHEMLLRKDVPINKNFQDVMLRLEQSGIGQMLYKNSLGILTIAKAETAAKNIMSYSYVCELGCSITLAQAAGAFYLWFIGCGLSFCAFIVEVMMKRDKRKRDIELHID